MKKGYTVYCHTLFDGRKYIGVTSQNVSRRWRNGKGYEGDNRFFDAIQKYGWESFDHEIIATNLSETDAHKLEKKLIKENNTQDILHGFNTAGGGKGFTNPSEERRKELSEMFTKINTGKKHTEEFKKRASERMKGDRNPNAHGKALTKERIEQFREYAKKPKTDEQKRKMSLSARKVKVVCVETGKEFCSMKEAAKEMGAKYTSLSCAVYRGTRCAGYHWKVKE